MGLLSLFFLQDLTFYAFFKLNQATLAQEHCVNRDKKDNHCQASCYLERQLKHDKDQKDHPVTPEQERIPFPILNPSCRTFKGLFKWDSHPFQDHHLVTLIGVIRNPLRPPV